MTDRFGGETVVNHYNSDKQTAIALNAEGQLLLAVRAYWFTWCGFYPFTDIYEAGQ